MFPNALRWVSVLVFSLVGSLGSAQVTAQFTSDLLGGTQPLRVRFTDQSQGAITSYSWSFGDGSVSAQQNPRHTYTSAGTFTVSLTVTGPSGSDTRTRPGYITIQAPPLPMPAFVGSPLTGLAPLTVNFTDLTVGFVTARSWSFGDGGISSLTNPTHVYNTAGTYSVSLTATGPRGSVTATQPLYVTVGDPPPVAAFGATPTSGTVPLNVAFNDLSTGTITSYAWDFGDGGGSSLANPSHTYNTAGTYTVSLQVTGPGGMDTATSVNLVTAVDPPPVAEFSGTPLSGPAPLLVQFTDASTGPVSTYSWTFGDGGSSSAQNPSHVYASQGTYSVILDVVGPGGADSMTKPSYVTVGPPLPPTASFSGTPIAGATPHVVTFTDQSTGSVTSWSWSFGDGGTSSLQNPTHTYTTAGIYTVSLTASSTVGTDTQTRPSYIVVIDGPPSADFVGAPLSGAAPLATSFTDLTAGNVTAWMWEFGDGNQSSLQNPVHTYTVAGTYSVSLSTQGPGGFDTATKTDYVVVAPPPPVAGFIAAPTSGIQPLQVLFTSTSTGPITSLLWNFGDGQTSNALAPAHVYAAPGTFTVSLTATGPGGSDTQTMVDFVTVAEAAPAAAFSATPTSGLAPLSVAFTDLSTGNVTSWNWTFGDGGTSNLQNPVRSYTTPGTYTVTLTATGPGGADVHSAPNLITVDVPPPSAAFTGTPLTGVSPHTVNFTDQSTGAVSGWSWDFGDGFASRLENPVHTYTEPGAYTVSLTVIGPGGSDSSTIVDYIVVLEPAPVAAFGGTPLAGVEPLTVAFSDFSTGNVTSWSWSFGDGGSSTLQNPTHTYTDSGSFTVSLTVTSPAGADSEAQPGFVVVNEAPPIADFAGSPLSGTGSLTTSFTDLSTGTISSRLWTFGDGGTSSAVSPTHAYTTAGTYTVSLAVFGPGGSDAETKVDYVTIAEAPPTPSFTAAPTSGTVPLTVSFSNLSSGTITSHSWTFGDGGTSTNPNPTHVYSAAGVYTVSLTVSGPGGSNTLTQTDLIDVAEVLPEALFSGSPLSGNAPLTVSFTDASTGVVTAYAWNFGDGGTSSVQNPTHTYAAAGSYSVSLTAIGPDGSDTETRVDYVVVAPAAPNAEFTGSPLSGVAPLTVGFQDQSTGSVTGWSWDFGDGSASILENPSHTYTEPGTYTVQLIAVGPGGTDTEVKPSFVVVNQPPPVAAFFGTPLLGVAPLTVFFTDVSSGDVNTHSWTFGDGGTSTLQNPSHVYSSPGNYTVSLTVIGAGGGDSETKVGYVTVLDQAPLAEFSATPTSGPTPLTVSFTDLSTGVATSYAWDFGDSATSTLQNPTHTYTQTGTYTVALIVSGPGGIDDEVKLGLITVGNPPPTAEFSATPTSGVVPLSVAFTDLSTGVATSYAWTFGDGGTSTLQNPIHVYPSVGTFTVSLTTTGPGGSDTETKVDLITVTEPAPTAAFMASPTSGLAPLTVNFTDQTTGVVTSWAWTFGDGGTSSVQDPMHTYAAPGTYTVSLTSTGPGGSDTATQADLIVVTPPAPTAAFVGSPLSGVAPLGVSFTDLSTGVVTTYAWTFGDGGTSSVQSPSHSYTSSGLYTVSLTVTGPGGSSTETKTDYVNVLEPAPVAEFDATPTAGSAPLNVAFTDLSQGAIQTWAWSFGDGGTSSLQDPTHVYAAAGTYTVSLTVVSPGGADSETKSGLITVNQPLLDGSFEGQTAGGAPAAPWSVTAGAAHVIQPDSGITTDNAFPTDLAQWADLSSDGTNAAVPPSNPGGQGNAPVGAAGISQTFTFEPTNPVLFFEAAFLLGEAAMSAGSNDFMSVDITNGSTTHNLYYADTFSSFPLTSARHGLPMTARARVQSNLEGLFPAATAATVLTLTIQLGNGGTAVNPSRGYVDNVLLGPAATIAFRNGSGVNPRIFVAPPPVVGTTWVSTIDPTPIPGAAVSVILAFAAPSPGIVIPGLGELLFDGGSPSFFTVGGAPLGVHSVLIPLDLGLVGISATVQGVVVNVASNLTLTNAVDVVTGFEAPVAPPVANLNATPTSGAAPLTVSFFDLSTGAVTAWDWSFGDGASSTAANPTHTYTTPGTYTVSLVVSGPGGFDIRNSFDLIVVTP